MKTETQKERQMERPETSRQTDSEPTSLLANQPASQLNIYTGAQTCGEATPTSYDCSVPIKTEPCDLPDTQLPSPVPCSQKHGSRPYSLRLKPFTAVDSASSMDLNSDRLHSGLGIVFKTEPLSESDGEEDSEAVKQKEPLASDVKAGSTVREVKKEHGCDVYSDGWSRASPINWQQESVCHALTSDRTIPAGWCNGIQGDTPVNSSGASSNNVSVNIGCDVSQEQEEETISGSKFVHEDEVSGSRCGGSQEPVPLKVVIKTEPDDILCIGMGLLSSTHNLEGMHNQDSGKLCVSSNHDNVLKNGEEKTFQAEPIEKKTGKKKTSRKSLQCPQCPSTFPCHSHLKRHLLSHCEERHFTCSVCQAKFKLLCHLKQHFSTHRGDRPYHCQNCPASFARSDHLKLHLRSHQGIRPYLCTVCNTAFTQAGHLRKHMIRHQDDRMVVCKIKACKAVFTSVHALQEHRKKHEEDRKCKECDAVLSRADDMKKHMLIHTQDKPYQCPVCPAQFRQAGHLSTHQLQHTGRKPFVCDQCGCSFKQSHHLKRHRQVHQGQGSFTCQVCSASFQRESSCTRHRQKCHSHRSDAAIATSI